MTKKTFSDFVEFYYNPKNQRPPSYTTIMAFMGWRSKYSVVKALNKLRKRQHAGNKIHPR